jgi:mono/diheme cytochrome c family protein
MRLANFAALLACLPALAQAQLAPGAASADLVARGSYLVNAVAGCVNCHSPKDQQGRPTAENTLSGGGPGGVWFVTPAFAVSPPNLTPDVETGIGSWTDEDIKRALLEGVRPAHDRLPNVPLAPTMYKNYFKAMLPRDLDAIVAYLRTVPAVRHAVPDPAYRAFAPAAPSPDAGMVYTDADMQDPIRRGRYLATVAHCMACHSGRAGATSDHVNALGKGGWVLDAAVIRGYPAEWKSSVASNITSDPVAGIGAWTDTEVKRAITQGVSRDGRRLGPPMAYSVYARMTDEDLSSMVAWLRTLPPLH